MGIRNDNALIYPTPASLFILCISRSGGVPSISSLIAFATTNIDDVDIAIAAMSGLA
jgi:hypothetical protein